MHKLWGGRFEESTSEALEKLNDSLWLDRRMFEEDIDGSIAYADALQDINLLTVNEAESIKNGLGQVRKEWMNGVFEIKDGDEDIHTANERRLIEIIGFPGAKLHTGRSRNDQSLTDTRLWLKRNFKILEFKVESLIKAIITRAEKEIDVIMPGYTHLQRAQPVRWSHFILNHAWNFKHDVDKMDNVMKTIDIMPLGSGALAGNPFEINRKKLAESLGFKFVSENSMQAVADRDFVVEFLFWASLLGNHLSRLAEDLIIFSSKEFEFITISDAFSTGSSLMPQKRNPDGLELIRAEGGNLFGRCCGFMMVLKGLPSTYNKDLQSDKEAIFSTFDKLTLLLEVAVGTVQTLRINFDKCRAAITHDMLATDVAYYLVRKGVAFRDAHHLAGQLVSVAEKKQVSIADVNIEELKNISSYFEKDIFDIWNFESSVEQYKAEGGTARSSVQDQIAKISTWLSSKQYK